MCQPYLNTAKTSIRSARHLIPNPSHMLHLPRKHPPLLDQDPTAPPWRNSCLPWPMQMAQFSILTSRKLLAEITNHQKSPTTCNLMQFWQIAWVYHPHSAHFSHTSTQQSPHCEPTPSSPHYSNVYMWKMCETPQ